MVETREVPRSGTQYQSGRPLTLYLVVVNKTHRLRRSLVSVVPPFQSSTDPPSHLLSVNDSLSSIFQKVCLLETGPWKRTHVLRHLNPCRGSLFLPLERRVLTPDGRLEPGLSDSNRRLGKDHDGTGEIVGKRTR